MKCSVSGCNGGFYGQVVLLDSGVEVPFCEDHPYDVEDALQHQLEAGEAEVYR